MRRNWASRSTVESPPAAEPEGAALEEEPVAAGCGVWLAWAATPVPARTAAVSAATRMLSRAPDPVPALADALAAALARARLANWLPRLTMEPPGPGVPP